MIYSTLKRGPWRKKAPRKDSPKRAMYEERIRRAQAAKDRDLALAEGAEYGSVFLAGWWRLNGCAACGKHRGFVNHHTKHRSQKGRAEWQVPICPIPCHVEDGRGVEGRAKEEHGVDLYAVARDLAEAGRAQGWLPVEMCETCGTWHSARLI